MSGFRKKHKVLRITGGDYDENGIWQEGAEEEFFIFASVQPLGLSDSDEYANLQPEGASRINAVKIYSNTPLNATKQALPDGTPGIDGDILVWRGKRWKVVGVREYQSDVINHYRMVAKEVEPYEGSNEEVYP